VEHGAVPQRQQVLGGQPGPSDFVVADDDPLRGPGDPRRAVRIVDHQHRYAGRHVVGEVCRAGGGGDGDGVDALAHQVDDGAPGLVLVILVGVYDADEVSGATGRALQAAQHRGGAEVRGAGGDDADAPRTPGHQGAGRLVRAVAEPLDLAQHPLAHGLADVGLTVDHAGDRLLRDARASGHVDHRHSVVCHHQLLADHR
jgi:hypothetical protein